MDIICFGMGAIGTYIGGSLASQGHRVTFLERKENLAQIKRCGIRLLLGDRLVRIEQVDVFDDIQNILKGQYDLAILAVKSFDTQSVLDMFTGLEEKIPPVLCLQNGVENEERIAVKLGDAKVIAGTITSAIGRSGLGEVKLEKLRGVGIETGHSLSQELITIMNDAGLKARGISNRDSMKWSKMLTNLLANASAAILNLPPKQIYENPFTFGLEVRQIEEALSVMKALEIKVIDLPGTPIRLLIRLLTSLPLKLSREITAPILSRGRGDKMPSFHIDLHSKSGRSEVGYLNGAIVRYGERLNIPTPVNRGLTRILEGLTLGQIPNSEYEKNPQKLIKAIGEFE